ncbi:MAG: hypothetical protein IJJ11_03060 [Methanosphaera sp.]|uniref:hypothetical protein n=1 Tax=Methanosphaera sp. BMS TaxID=1789762 RepID=UPI000DC1F1E0|nr:hypothetical protein [Methanosphaera sp. BMS]AWX32927.1 hypothetical protein AW729_07355 [Methanosphaera sp. BMS]MBQ6443646.1 hypothetical protein [Methanosphaera sp.]
MSRILKILLFIIAILAFFEVGLFVSYTVIASEPVNPVDIISMQLDQGSRFINSLTGEKNLNQQDTLNITNKENVALILNNQTGLSVNLDSLTAKVSTSQTGNQTVTINAIASKDSQSTGGGAIVILPEQTYSISAIATGEVYSNGKVKINTTTIELKERIVLYNQNNVTSSKNQSIESLVNYTNNLTNNTTTSNQSNNSR